MAVANSEDRDARMRVRNITRRVRKEEGGGGSHLKGAALTCARLKDKRGRWTSRLAATNSASCLVFTQVTLAEEEEFVSESKSLTGDKLA